jgi:hypothetical protein
VSYAYSGAPEPVAVDQDGAGQVLLVTLDDRAGRHVVTIEPKRVGQTRAEKLDLDVSGVHNQPELIEMLARHSDANLVFSVRLTGLFPDDLDLDLEEVDRALAPSFLKFRLRDMSIPAGPEGLPAPPDTVLGAFVGTVEARIAELEKATGATPTVVVAPSETAEPDVPVRSGHGTATIASPEMDPAEELADLREALRLGRHLLEGRQVTL